MADMFLCLLHQKRTRVNRSTFRSHPYSHSHSPSNGMYIPLNALGWMMLSFTLGRFHGLWLSDFSAIRLTQMVEIPGWITRGHACRIYLAIFSCGMLVLVTDYYLIHAPEHVFERI